MIGTKKYFPARYFAPRYWPEVGGEPSFAPSCGPKSVTRIGPSGIVKQFQKVTALGRIGKDCCCG